MPVLRSKGDLFTPSVAYDLLLTSEEGNFTKDGAGLITTWNDTSGNGNNATQETGANQPQWQSNVDGSQAVLFSGNQWLDNITNTQYANQDTASVEFWFKTSVATGLPFGLYEGTSVNRFVIYLASGKINLQIYDNNVAQLRLNTPLTYNDNTWHHFSYNTDVNGNRVYIDGVQITPAYSTGSASTQYFTNLLSIDKFRIGDYLDGTLAYDGYIDDIIINLTEVRTSNFTPTPRS